MDATDRAKIVNARERAKRALDVIRRDLTATLEDVVNLRIESPKGGLNHTSLRLC